MAESVYEWEEVSMDQTTAFPGAITASSEASTASSEAPTASLGGTTTDGEQQEQQRRQ